MNQFIRYPDANLEFNVNQENCQDFIRRYLKTPLTPSGSIQHPQAWSTYRKSQELHSCQNHLNKLSENFKNFKFHNKLTSSTNRMLSSDSDNGSDWDSDSADACGPLKQAWGTRDLRNKELPSYDFVSNLPQDGEEYLMAVMNERRQTPICVAADQNTLEDIKRRKSKSPRPENPPGQSTEPQEPAPPVEEVKDELANFHFETEQVLIDADFEKLARFLPTPKWRATSISQFNYIRMKMDLARDMILQGRYFVVPAFTKYEKDRLYWLRFCFGTIDAAKMIDIKRSKKARAKELYDEAKKQTGEDNMGESESQDSDVEIVSKEEAVNLEKAAEEEVADDLMTTSGGSIEGLVMIPGIESGTCGKEIEESSPKTSLDVSPKAPSESSPKAPSESSPKAPSESSNRHPSGSSIEVLPNPSLTSSEISSKAPSESSSIAPSESSPKAPSESSPKAPSEPSPKAGSDSSNKPPSAFSIDTPSESSPKSSSETDPQTIAKAPNKPFGQLNFTSPTKDADDQPSTSKSKAQEDDLDPFAQERKLNGTRPTTNLLLSMPQRLLEYLLSLQLEWLKEFGLINRKQGTWLYATIGSLQVPFEPDVVVDLRHIALQCVRIRDLAKKCILEGDSGSPPSSSSITLITHEDTKFCLTDVIAACNLFITIVVDHFVQKDLNQYLRYDGRDEFRL